VNAGFYVLLLAFMIAIFSFGFPTGPPGSPGPPRDFFIVMTVFFSVFYSLFMLPSIIAGYALLKKKSWARVASIVAGVIAGMNMPFGTAACVYALWFFFSDNWKEIYETGEHQFNFDQCQIAYGVESQQAAYEAEAKEKVPFRPYEPPDWR
jgi:hypothetical protein